MSGFAAVWDRLPRPLDPFASFKMKMGLLVGSAIILASFTFWIGASWQFRYALLAALVTSLALTQFLAHGMTSPLRQMTNAAGAMARGDYSRRVRATSRDEIGQLATAFNQMAADLGAADEYRRGLIGNVSHELRTPIAALHAVLENVVDGVAEPDAETMRMALSQTARLGELVTNLLDLSRVEGGAIPLQLELFQVDQFLHDAIEHVAVSPANVRIAVVV
jgi:signal transduction histidine kinase